jgi:hypothetical protein
MTGWLMGGEHYYCPGMVLSRVGTRADSVWGGGLITPRWTPALAVRDEDLLDQMDAIEAAHYEHPPSITGIQLSRIRALKGKRVRIRKEDASVVILVKQTPDGQRISLVLGPPGRACGSGAFICTRIAAPIRNLTLRRASKCLTKDGYGRAAPGPLNAK